MKPDANGRITQTPQILTSVGGLGWSADQHRLVAGDFNGDGLADVFLQARASGGTHGILLADANTQFTTAAQTWSNGFLGFKWTSLEANVYAGDFNADGYADLLIQAQPKWITIDNEVPFPVPTYPPNMNGIAFSHSSGTLFSTAAVSGQAQGYYAWSRNAFESPAPPSKSSSWRIGTCRA